MGILASEYSGRGLFNILDVVKQCLSLNETFIIRVPTNVLKRASLMCVYIQDDVGCEFELDNLLELLYMDFVKYAVKNYNPTRVLKEATRKQRDFDVDDTITIQIGGQAHKVKREDAVKYSEVEVKLPKNEYKKGQLILDELESLYGCKIPFEVMFGNLLINFIEDYKEGINKRAYISVVKMLKRVFNE